MTHEDKPNALGMKNWIWQLDEEALVSPITVVWEGCDRRKAMCEAHTLYNSERKWHTWRCVVQSMASRLTRLAITQGEALDSMVTNGKLWRLSTDDDERQWTIKPTTSSDKQRWTLVNNCKTMVHMWQDIETNRVGLTCSSTKLRLVTKKI